MNLQPDEWLAGVFGYDVFKASLPAQAGDELLSLPTDMLLTVAAGRPAFFYAKVPTNRVDHVRALNRLGFYVVDGNVTFERRPDPRIEEARSAAISIRDVAPVEHEAVLDIAVSCFVYTRFHLDPRVPLATANAVKREWINSYLHRRRGERLLVASAGNGPVGFLAVLRHIADGKTIYVIDLIGVAKTHQGQGVGKSLTDYFINDYAGKCDCLRVGTQVANVRSMRLYETCGFRVADSAYVLHAHVRDGKPVQ